VDAFDVYVPTIVLNPYVDTLMLDTHGEARPLNARMTFPVLDDKFILNVLVVFVYRFADL
jgi:hypothetical protein